ncbi:MAG: T9SS type A sorting domain-containing protein [Chitinophagales bacterium]|nr:T9SS type A sorting domain-containing protein [Chitinophagales bacterium]
MYTKTLFLVIASFISINVFTQARFILNGAYININDSAFLVIDNPNSNAITRNSGYIISEGEYNKVRWNIATTNGSYTIPFGFSTTDYLPLQLSTSGASGTNGYFDFSTNSGNWQNSTYLPTQPTGINVNYNGIDNSENVIDRFWLIDAINYTTKPNLSNLTFSYRDVEHTQASNTITEANLGAQRWNDVTQDWYDFLPSGTVNTTTNQVTVASVSSSDFFSWWTLVEKESPLPVQLTAFNATCNENSVELTWQTASEINNSHFEIERSTNAQDFESIATIPTQNGNANNIQNYQTVDENPLSTITYYRLKQVDNNGNYTYSSIVKTNCSTSNQIPIVNIYPIPATNFITVDIKHLVGNKQLIIYNTEGKVMHQQSLNNDENVVQQIDISNYAKANYILRIDVDNTLFQIIKFIKY